MDAGGRHDIPGSETTDFITLSSSGSQNFLALVSEVPIFIGHKERGPDVSCINIIREGSWA